MGRKGDCTRPARGRRLRNMSIASSIATLVAAGSAQASPTLSLSAGFAPGTHLGEPTTATASVGIAGTEYGGFPLPLTQMTLRLPKGTTLTDEGFARCSAATLEPSGEGPRGCPAGSSAGRGMFSGYVAFGRETVPEHGTIELFFAPEGGLLLFLFGHEPVLLELLARGHYVPASGGSGPGIAFELPLVETVPGAPFSSLSGLSFELGAIQGSTGSVTAPSECSTSLAWEASGHFTDTKGHEADTSGETGSPCLLAGKRVATTTVLQLAEPKLTEGEGERFTATVSANPPGSEAPTGTVTLKDDGLPLFGCESLPLSESSGRGTAGCESYPFFLGSQAITAFYGGDLNFGVSESAPVGVEVGESSATEEESRRLSEERADEAARAAAEAAARKAAEEAAARKAAEEAAKRASEEAAKHGVEAFTAAAGALPSWLSPHGHPGKIGALLKQGGYSISVPLPPGTSLTIDWYLLRAGAHLAARKPTLLAAGSTTAGAGGSTNLAIKLTAAGRKLLRHSHSVKVTARGTLRGAAGNASTSTRSFRVSR